MSALTAILWTAVGKRARRFHRAVEVLACHAWPGGARDSRVAPIACVRERRPDPHRAGPEPRAPGAPAAPGTESRLSSDGCRANGRAAGPVRPFDVHRAVLPDGGLSE